MEFVFMALGVALVVWALCLLAAIVIFTCGRIITWFFDLLN